MKIFRKEKNLGGASIIEMIIASGVIIGLYTGFMTLQTNNLKTMTNIERKWGATLAAKGIISSISTLIRPDFKTLIESGPSNQEGTIDIEDITEFDWASSWVEIYPFIEDIEISICIIDPTDSVPCLTYPDPTNWPKNYSDLARHDSSINVIVKYKYATNSRLTQVEVSDFIVGE